MAEKLLGLLKNPLKFRLYLLKNLPMGLIAGLRIEEVNKEEASVSIRYGYLTKNPFKSLYFACLAMAAELPSGLLGLVQISATGKKVSMLVVHMDAKFVKKAVGKIVFTCADGKEIENTIRESISTGEGKTVVTSIIGKDEVSDVVAEFKITWSFKAKN